MSRIAAMNEAIYTGRGESDDYCKHGEAVTDGSMCGRCAFEAMNETDNVNSPPHYKQGDIECIDAIEAALTAEEFRGYCKGNALKYVWREKHKGQNESLEKAIWYLDRAITPHE